LTASTVNANQFRTRDQAQSFVSGRSDAVAPASVTAGNDGVGGGSTIGGGGGGGDGDGDEEEVYGGNDDENDNENDDGDATSTTLEQQYKLYVDALDEEQVVALYIKSTEDMKAIQKQISEKVTPMRLRAATLRSQILEFMDSAGASTVKVDDWFVSKGNRACATAAIEAGLLDGVVSDLTPEVLTRKAQEIEQARQARRAAFLQGGPTAIGLKSKTKKRNTSSVASASKRSRTSSVGTATDGADGGTDTISIASSVPETPLIGGKPAVGSVAKLLARRAYFPASGGRPAGAEGVAGDGGGGEGAASGIVFPEESAVVYHGKWAQRAPPPLAPEALTRKQVLAEVLYTMVEERCRGQKTTLRWSAKPSAAVAAAAKKPAVAGDDAPPPVLVEAPPEVAEVCKTWRQVHDAMPKTYAETIGPRAAAKVAKSMCEPRLRAFLASQGPLRRDVPLAATGDGGSDTDAKRTISLEVEAEGKLQVKTRMSMWDVSKLVDTAAEAVLQKLGVCPDEAFSPESDAEQLCEDFAKGFLRDTVLELVNERETQALVQASPKIKARRLPVAASAFTPL
jgi:hypothetical protein